MSGLLRPWHFDPNLYALVYVFPMVPNELYVDRVVLMHCEVTFHAENVQIV